MGVFFGAILVSATHAAWADFNLDFSSTDPLWVTDRYAPAGFTNVLFDGDSRLRLTISPQDSAANRPAAFSSAFYNTQGRQHLVDITNSWSLTAQTYVGLDALSGPNLRRTDVWVSTGILGTETGADYFMLGYYRMSPTDPFNPNATDITSGWRVWNDNLGWVNLALTLTAGWHDVGISYDNTLNLASFSIDGQLVYSETPAGNYADHLRTVMLEAYNFGQNPGYDVYWDNLGTQSGPLPVPEPRPIGFAALILGVYVVSLRKKAKRLHATV